MWATSGRDRFCSDILRKRGNQHQEMLAHGVSSVLMYDSELVNRAQDRLLALYILDA
jgi:hypothetical protein